MCIRDSPANDTCTSLSSGSACRSDAATSASATATAGKTCPPVPPAAKSTRRGGRDGDSSADASALARARAARVRRRPFRSCGAPRWSPRSASLKRALRPNANPFDASRRHLDRGVKVTTRLEGSTCLARAIAACDRGCAARASSIAYIAEPLARASDAYAGVRADARPTPRRRAANGSTGEDARSAVRLGEEATTNLSCIFFMIIRSTAVAGAVGVYAYERSARSEVRTNAIKRRTIVIHPETDV